MDLQLRQHFFIRVQVWIMWVPKASFSIAFHSATDCALRYIYLKKRKAILTCFPPFQTFLCRFALMHTTPYCTRLCTRAFLLSLRGIRRTPTAMCGHDSCTDRLQHAENMQPTSRGDALSLSSTDQLCLHSQSCHFKVLLHAASR